MKFIVNEKSAQLNDDNLTLFQIREKYKKDADIVIYNGFPVKQDRKIKENDRITLIKRGEIPKKEEIENLMIARHTPKVHEALKKAKVAIAGLGGLGSTCAISLARIGVGYLKIIDFDVVEPSNLNRQQYFIKDIGMKKCMALKNILHDINPFIKVDSVDSFVSKDNVFELFNDMDIVIEGFDSPQNKAVLVQETLLQTKKPKIITASGMAGFYSNNTICTKKINERLYICGDLKNEAKINEGLMAPRVSIAANHEANMALRLILDKTEV
ncbi:sulfur carrier protein ThiS adenylyltransferase ThiF [Clostridium sp. BJN0001]|uniref:sulfur carrier protein ThiS adenylyltransferase ThiF n=1 Tax=Clostridium sp. BJN0001 TaxID=2930219 RepID=UPI001FD18070|nr:sulfur carrier protein ThiS adenylyltransferase ThiF [Clostridium sp. BJN0001]